MASKDNGITAFNPPKGTDVSIVVVFLTLALYNVTELAFIIPTTFKRRSGNYFWFFVLATWSIVPYSVGFLMKGINFLPEAIFFWVFLCYSGWVGMVLFQSLVLWSRLHLILHSQRRLRAVLIMIIVDAVICDVPVAVLAFGSNSKNPGPFAPIYAIYESIHITLFALQELVISAVYVWETSKLIRLERDSGGTFNLAARSRVMTHLIYVSVIVVLLDIPTLALQYSEMYALQTAYKGFVYSVKLKLEFSILNKLIEVTRNRPATEPTARPVYNGNNIPMNAIVATASSAPTTLKSQDDCPVRAAPPPSLHWISRQHSRGAILDSLNTTGSISPMEVEVGASEAIQAIQVAVETQGVVESRAARGGRSKRVYNPRREDEKDSSDRAERGEEGLQGAGGVQGKEPGVGRSSVEPLRPHPSESMDLPAMLLESGPSVLSSGGEKDQDLRPLG